MSIVFNHIGFRGIWLSIEIMQNDEIICKLFFLGSTLISYLMLLGLEINKINIFLEGVRERR
jgi:hypothetical protein